MTEEELTVLEEELTALASSWMRTLALSPRPVFQNGSYISEAKKAILLFLCFGEDGITAGELSRRIRISTPNIAMALKALEKKGYITRRKGEEDKRTVFVFLTPKGRECILKRHEAVVRSVSYKLGQLGLEDAKNFVRLATKMLEIEAASQPIVEEDF